MLSNGIIAAAVCFLVLGGGFFFVLRSIARRRARQRGTSSTSTGGRVFAGSVEAMKNTLRHEVHDLSLGVAQVERYIERAKCDSTETKTTREQASDELDKARKLKVDIESAIDGVTTEAQIAAFATGLDQARLHVRRARALILSLGGNDGDITLVGENSALQPCPVDAPSGPPASSTSPEHPLVRVIALEEKVQEQEARFSALPELPETLDERRIVREQLRMARFECRLLYSIHSGHHPNPDAINTEWCHTAAELYLQFARARLDKLA